MIRGTLAVLRRKAVTWWCKPRAEKLWCASAFLLLGVARVALLTVPFRRIAPLLGHDMQTAAVMPLASECQVFRALRIGRAIRTAARYTPWESKCLAQALAARVLLGVSRTAQKGPGPFCRCPNTAGIAIAPLVRRGGPATPRPARRLPIGSPVHVTNRGNDRRQLFFGEADYRYFIELLAEATLKFPVDVLGYCVMPNHFHLLLCQREPHAVSAYLHRVSCISACMFRELTGSLGLGHVYQRRFWSRVVEHESDYLVAMRYVEANALRAQLVSRAEDWPWGSLWERLTGKRTILARSLVTLPPQWPEIVNRVQPPEELERLRAPGKPGRPRTRAGTR